MYVTRKGGEFVARIVEKRLPGHRTPVYYYQHSYRIKLQPEDRGKGPNSGPSRVKTESVYLGTAEQIRDRCRLGQDPQAVSTKEFGWVAGVMSMIEKLGLVEAVNRIVAKRDQGLTPGIYVALGIVAKLCAPATSWNTFGAWIQKTILPEYWNLPPSLLDAQNFWDHWDLLCSESTITRTSDDDPVLESDTVFQIEEAVWEAVQAQYHIRLEEVLYDATNCYTFLNDATPASVAQRGHNKAGRDERRQIGIALAATRDGGIPLLSLVYRGNCHDARLFPEAMTRLVNRITHLHRDALHMMFIFDRGNNSAENLQNLVRPSTAERQPRIDVIGGLVATQHRDLLRKPLRQYRQIMGDLPVWSGPRTVYGLDATVVLTYHAGLATRQRRVFDRQIAKAQTQMTTYWADRKRGSMDDRIRGLTRLKKQIRGGRYWQVSVETDGTLRLRADQAARALRRAEFGKRLLFTTDRSRSVEDILAAYNHDKPQIEGDFRLLKAVDCLRIQPIRHWTDSKIRVYALICVLSLLVLKLLSRTLDTAELHMSPDVLRTELADIEAVYLEMAPGHIRRVLTQWSTVQQQICDILGLGRYEPSRASATVPLHTING